MSQLLLEIIASQNPETLHKFIEKHLPNDSKKLQIIEEQLRNYNFEQKNIANQEGITQNKFVIKKKKVHLDFKTKNSHQQAIKRSYALIESLKEKGYNPLYETSEEGMVLYQREQKKISKPLKVNPSTFYLQKTNIDRLCKRYELNKQLYEGEIQGFDGQQIVYSGFDQEMNIFLQRRKQVLKAINDKKDWMALGKLQSNKQVKKTKPKIKFRKIQLGTQSIDKKTCSLNKEKNINLIKTDIQTLSLNSSKNQKQKEHLRGRGYSIPSLLNPHITNNKNNKIINKHNSVENFPQFRKTSILQRSQTLRRKHYLQLIQQQNRKVQRIINTPNKIKIRQPLASVPKIDPINKKLQVNQKKLDLQKNEDIDDSIRLKVIKSFEKQYYRRYDSWYMSMIKANPQRTRIANMNNYGKQLLKDQLKMRKYFIKNTQ